MQELPEGLHRMLSDIIGGIKDDDDSDVIKTIPLKKEWKKLHSETIQSLNKGKQFVAQADTLRRKMWADIELDTGIYDKRMRYNRKKQVIEVRDSEDDDDE